MVTFSEKDQKEPISAARGQAGRRDQRSETRDQRSETRDQRPEITRDQSSKTGAQRPELRDRRAQRLELKDRRSEIRRSLIENFANLLSLISVY
jgi:hypothetical protein